MDQERLSRQRYLFHFSGLAFLESVLTILWLAAIPTETSSTIFLGFSLNRLLLMLVPLCIALVSVVGLLTHKYSDRIVIHLQKRIFIKVSFLLGISLIGFLLYASAQSQWQMLYGRMLPVITLLIFIFLEWPILIVLSSYLGRQQTLNWLKTNIQFSLKTMVIITVVFLLLYCLSTVLYPLTDKENFWWDSAVPLLFWQLAFSIFVVKIYGWFENKFIKLAGKKLDWMIFAVIFVVFGILWSSAPVQSNYFTSKPGPPNFVSYPASDSAIFDLQAQSVLQGYGLNNGRVLDRPIYPAFLAILHIIIGQDMADNMAVQAFIFAILPALVYLICISIGPRIWGMFASLIVGFWGLNGINASNVLNTSSPKHILTEYPLAIALAFLMLISLKWYKTGFQGQVYPAILGGVIALAAYLRYSALILLPFWMMLPIVYQGKITKKVLVTICLILCGFVIISAPWHIRNSIRAGGIVIPYTKKISFVVNTRLTSSTNIQNATEETDTTRNNRKAGNNVENNEENDVNQKLSTADDLAPENTAYGMVGIHLLHNMMSSFFILPVSLQLADLQTTLKLGGDLWKYNWDGILKTSQLLIFILQAIILSFGISHLFRKNKYASIILIFIYTGISISNSLGMSSGGRFIVPVNWIVLIVYGAGLLKLLESKFSIYSNNEVFIAEKSTKHSLGLVISGLLIIGMLPVMIDYLSLKMGSKDITQFPQKTDMLGYLHSNTILGDIVDFEDIKKSQPYRLKKGVLYYPAIVSVSDQNLAEDVSKFIRKKTITRFFIMESDGYTKSFFLFNKQINLENTDKVYFLGCRNSGMYYIQHLFIQRSDSFEYYKGDNTSNICLSGNEK